MMTTKKVAKKRVLKKVAKKTVSKKTVLKKTAKKKVKKKAAQKKVTKKQKKHSPDFADRLAKLEVIAKNTSIVPRNSGTKADLLVLSPYRFPLIIDNLSIQTVKASGLFFVLIGAFFALLNLNFIQPDLSLLTISENSKQVANICDVSNSDSDSNKLNCSSYVTEESNDSNLIHFTNPAAQISVENVGPLMSEVTIEVNVVNAKNVSIFIYETSSDTYHKLGDAIYTSGDNWHINWNTKDFDDGEYKIKALVTNLSSNDTYEQQSRPYTIENYPTSEVDQINTVHKHVSNNEFVLTSQTETIISDSYIKDNNFDISNITLDHSNSQNGYLNFEIEVSGGEFVEKIKLTTKNIDTNEIKIFKNVYQVNEKLWKFDLDTKLLSNGEYVIVVQAFDSNNRFKEGKIDVIIENSSKVNSSKISEDLDGSVFNLNIEPEINISLDQASPLSGWVTVKVEVDKKSKYVEIFQTEITSGVKKFVALANETYPGSGVWLLALNTAHLPNSERKIFANIKTNHGEFLSDSLKVVIYNKPVTKMTSDRLNKVARLEALVEEKEEVVNLSVNDMAQIDESSAEFRSKEILLLYRDELDNLFERLAAAIRIEDEPTVKNIKAEILSIKKEIILLPLTDKNKNEIFAKVINELDETLIRVENDVERTKLMVIERTGELARTDSDQDGVTDYDEINIFETNPFLADTDGDGFNDGAEILGGFNPTDDSPEVAIIYESPKNMGVIREDLLEVSDVFAVESEPTDIDGVKEEAVFVGKALPSSFITLYIFSTPIVVTIKTDQDGSWEYRFDKELEDGEHEVYVGVTDNSGKIIAKSKPFNFIKEAQAFTPVDASNEVESVDDAESLVDQKTMLAVLSISVVVIGLLLILVGMKLDSVTKKKKSLAEDYLTQTT